VTSEFPPQPGGIGTHAHHLAKYLEMNAYEVAVIADERSISGEEERNFDSLLRFNVYRVSIRQVRLFMYIKRILLLFRYIKTADIVVASGKFSLWSVAFASLFFKRNYIAVIHGSEVNFKNMWLKKSVNASLKRFKTLIAVSHYTNHLVSKIHSNIVVIPNGIDIEGLQTYSAQKLPLTGTPKLVTVGNVTERKGQLNVIKQLPELLKHYPSLHYHCIGLPTKKDAFLDVVKALDIEEHVTFHGRVSDERLRSFLKSSDIFVMLSSPTPTGDVEGFGIALLEANYFGLPCIGSKGCGIEDAIKDGASGRLIRYYDTDELLSAMKTILSDYEAYQSRSRVWAKQHSWQIIVKHYIEAIEV
jgi:phosphatidylinositol alpha-1,6-mannosyltransferase